MGQEAGTLERYWQKRDFAKTPEPRGEAGQATGYRYLIQKHAARRLHYDFRLELDGVLKSWAVTRGPSLDPRDKRLAVQTEDHPLEYGSFEGIIPQGQYGGGTVMLWDEGSWEPLGDPREGLRKGKLEFLLHGKRLSGEWTLVRMAKRGGEKDRSNWLLIKHSDEVAQPGEGDTLLAQEITSIASGRTMEAIASDEDAVWQSEKEKTSHLELPEFIPPQLATLGDAIPQGKGWVHEIKFDGYRALAYIADGSVRIYTRTGKDWTHKFPTLCALLAQLPVRSAVLDGEIVALEEERTSFKALQNALSEHRDETLQYYVFDLLLLNGKALVKKPLLERKAMLEPLLKTKKHTRLFYSEHLSALDAEALQRLCRMKFEGVISKRVDAPYSSGRGRVWMKTKCSKRQEFIIGGFTPPTHAERGIGALLLGYYEDEALIYAGRVGTGFDHKTSLQLRKKLDGLQRDKHPFEFVSKTDAKEARWVAPELVCEIEFAEWTEEGRLRHPSFQGLREDKPAMAINREREVATKPQENAPTKVKKNTKDAEVGGIRISHPQRIVYPGTTITKQALAEYYLEVAEYILPHVAKRPLSLIRCPEGIEEECFFQRHITRGQSPYLHDTGIQVKGRQESYLMIEDAPGLITLVQWGVVELHPWGALADKAQLPDRMIFDLDPDPQLPWKEVIAGAKEVRERMQEFGLQSFVKTTGGKGLHVVVPMTRHYGWPAVKAFARAVAESMAHDTPSRYIAKASKAAREGKIFVDYLRNDLTSTAVAPYSARAREGAPVAMPVAWERLNAKLEPGRFTIETVPLLLKKQKQDPWSEFFKVKQKIAAAHLRALNISTQ